MKQLVIISGLVMSMTMDAMNVGKTAEGATPLAISDEVAQMPTDPRKSPKKKASPQMRAELTKSMQQQHEALLQLAAKQKAEKNNNQ